MGWTVTPWLAGIVTQMRSQHNSTNMKDFEQRVINVMIYQGMLPTNGVFDITEEHLKSYIEVYGSIFGTQSGGTRTKQNLKYARKLAGRTLIRLLSERGARFNQIRAGMVYMISNPAFPDHLKIGMTLDVIARLAQYQTYDPMRQFKLERYNFVLDRRHNERLILTHPDIINESGEWVEKTTADTIFLRLVK